MSGFTPFVSSSPPPFDDADVELQDDDDDDDFSEFASAAVVTSTVMPVIAEHPVKSSVFSAPGESDAYDLKVELKNPEDAESEQEFQAMGGIEREDDNFANMASDFLQDEPNFRGNFEESEGYGDFSEILGDDDRRDACSEEISVLCGFKPGRFLSPDCASESSGMDSMVVNADLESRGDSILGSEDFDAFQSVDVENEASDEEDEWKDDLKDYELGEDGEGVALKNLGEDVDDFKEFQSTEVILEVNIEERGSNESDENSDRLKQDDASVDDSSPDDFKHFKTSVNISDPDSDSAVPDIQLRKSTIENDDGESDEFSSPVGAADFDKFNSGPSYGVLKDDDVDFDGSISNSDVPKFIPGCDVLKSTKSDDEFDDYSVAEGLEVSKPEGDVLSMSNVDEDFSDFAENKSYTIGGIGIKSDVDEVGNDGDDDFDDFAEADHIPESVGGVKFKLSYVNAERGDDFDDFNEAFDCVGQNPDKKDDDGDEFENFQNSVKHDSSLFRTHVEKSSGSQSGLGGEEGGGWAAFESSTCDSGTGWVQSAEEGGGNFPAFEESSGKADDDEDEFGQFNDSHPSSIVQTPSSSSASSVLSSCFSGKTFHQTDNNDLDQHILLLDLMSRVVRRSSIASADQHRSTLHKSNPDKSTTDASVWNNLKSMEHTAALKFHWPTSSVSRALLHSINIDTRNVLVGHKKLSTPIFASSLGLLEPKKATTDLRKSPPMETKTLKPAVAGMNATESPQVEFDWQGSGLTNPLDASEKEKELLEALEPATIEPQKTLSLETILASMSFIPSTRNVATQQKDDGRKLSSEALAVLNKLPDLSFMQAKVLMFPMKGEMTVN